MLDYDVLAIRCKVIFRNSDQKEGQDEAKYNIGPANIEWSVRTVASLLSGETVTGILSE